MKQEEKLIKSTHQCFSFWYNVLCLGTQEQSHYNSFITPFKAIFSCCLYLQGVAIADSPNVHFGRVYTPYTLPDGTPLRLSLPGIKPGIFHFLGKCVKYCTTEPLYETEK